MKKEVKSFIYKAKSAFYLNELNENKGKQYETSYLIKIPPICKKIDNMQDKAEEFNNFFANVSKNTFVNSQKQLCKKFIDPETHDSNKNIIHGFRSQPVDVNTVILVIKHLNNTKSTGSDDISLTFVKDSLYIITFYLTYMINTSFVNRNCTNGLETGYCGSHS